MRRLKAKTKREKCKYKRCTFKRTYPVDKPLYCEKHGDNLTTTKQAELTPRKEDQKHFVTHFAYHASSAHGRAILPEAEPKPSFYDKILAFIFIEPELWK